MIFEENSTFKKRECAEMIIKLDYDRFYVVTLDEDARNVLSTVIVMDEVKIDTEGRLTIVSPTRETIKYGIEIETLRVVDLSVPTDHPSRIINGVKFLTLENNRVKTMDTKDMLREYSEQRVLDALGGVICAYDIFSINAYLCMMNISYKTHSEHSLELPSVYMLMHKKICDIQNGED